MCMRFMISSIQTTFPTTEIASSWLSVAAQSYVSYIYREIKWEDLRERERDGDDGVMMREWWG